jgi:hypothetical protein
LLLCVSFGAVEARTAAALDKVEREKQEHIADIKLLGAVVAFELKPVLADLVTEIRTLISAIKDKQRTTKMLQINVADTINIRHCAGQSPTQATVSAIDQTRQLATVSYLSGPLVAQPAGQVHLSMCRKVSDPYQFSAPTGTIWDL